MFIFPTTTFVPRLLLRTHHQPLLTRLHLLLVRSSSNAERSHTPPHVFESESVTSAPEKQIKAASVNHVRCVEDLLTQHMQD